VHYTQIRTHVEPAAAAADMLLQLAVLGLHDQAQAAVAAVCEPVALLPLLLELSLPPLLAASAGAPVMTPCMSICTHEPRYA
jgi:hypothetical protein